MKGTEGIDYVIIECSHCKGSGKCKCYDCLYAAAVRVEGIPQYHTREINDKVSYLKKEGFEVTCKVCKGVGKIVFWHE